MCGCTPLKGAVSCDGKRLQVIREMSLQGQGWMEIWMAGVVQWGHQFPRETGSTYI